MAGAVQSAVLSATASAHDVTALVLLAQDPGSAVGLGMAAGLQHAGGPLGQSLASAVSREDGFIAAAAQVSAPEAGHLVNWWGTAVFRESYTNGTGAPLPYVLDFDIFAMSLRIQDLEGLVQEAMVRAEVHVVHADGHWDTPLSLEQTLRGSYIEHELLTGLRNNFTPVAHFTCLEQRWACVDYRVDFDPIHAELQLGTFQPGERFEVEYTLEAVAGSRAIGVNGASAFIGDPFSVTSPGARGSVQPLAAVPEPAPWVLLAGGMAALALRRRQAC